MARQAVAYLILGSLAATLVQCSSERSNEPQPVTAPPPQAPTAEPMTPAAGTTPAAPTAETTPAPAAEAQPAAPAAEAPTMTMSDEQIAAITDAANNGEIEQAKIAQKNAKNARVKKFAAMMITDHTQAKQKQKKLLGKLNVTPATSAMASQLETEGQQKLEEIKALKGAEFDRAYIDAQVEAHQKVLDAFDKQLIPQAKNTDFKALLSEIRPKIAAHLEEAKEIQQALGETSTGTSTGQTGKSEGSSGTKSSPEHKH
jgi:putative membrane protein